MTDRELVLLRHAKSDWYSSATQDADRPLNSRGRRDAARVGRYLKNIAFMPEAVRCSDAARTTETLAGILKEAGWNAQNMDIEYQRELYLSSRSAILHSVEEAFREYAKVLLIGHNPEMDEAVLHFWPGAPYSGNGKLMTTAALCRIIWCSGLDRPSSMNLMRAGDLPIP